MINIIPSPDSRPACAACDRRDQETRAQSTGRPTRFYDVRFSGNPNYTNVVTLCNEDLKNLATLISMLLEL